LEKEKIRTQIVKSLKAYRDQDGFEFFDKSNSNSGLHNSNLDNTGLEVLLMRINHSDWILITTENLFINLNDSITKIKGVEIDKVEFLNRQNKVKLAEFKEVGKMKKCLNSGDFRITKKDKIDFVVNLPHHEFGYCLIKAIRKLKFVLNKYQ